MAAVTGLQPAQPYRQAHRKTKTTYHSNYNQFRNQKTEQYMAHNLNYNDKTQKHCFFSVKEKAWHGLGQIVKDYPTRREALQFAGLDYTVEKRTLFTYDTENNQANPDTDIVIPEIQVPGYYA